MAATLPPPLPPPAPSKTTAAQICRWALMSIGRLGATQPLDPDDLATSFEMLNGMVDAWKLNELLLDYLARADCPLVAGQSRYTIGPGGDFNVAFPPQIYAGSLVLGFASGTAIERPLGAPRSMRNIPTGVVVDQVPNDFPDRFFYQPVYENPTLPGEPPGCGILTVYPVPDNDRHLFSVWFPQILDTFAEPLQEFYLRPGMVRALRTNLAMEIAPLFSADPSPDLRRQAKAAYDALQVIGGQPNERTLDPSLTWRHGRYNLYADDWSLAH